MPSTYFCEPVRRSSVQRWVDDLLTSIQGHRINARCCSWDSGFTCRLHNRFSRKIDASLKWMSIQSASLNVEFRKMKPSLCRMLYFAVFFLPDENKYTKNNFWALQNHSGKWRVVSAKLRIQNIKSNPKKWLKDSLKLLLLLLIWRITGNIKELW